MIKAGPRAQDQVQMSNQPSTPTLPPFVAFMVRLPHWNIHLLENIIKQYSCPNENPKYLIAAEKDPQGREHFHCILMDTSKVYERIARHFRKTLGLCGQATKGKTREYGRVRNIRDKVTMLSYTIKDNNVTTSPAWDIDLTLYNTWKKKSIPNKELREKELKEIMLYYNANHTIIKSTNWNTMDDYDFRTYQDICKEICKCYAKYHFNFPVLTTMNKLMVKYGIMNIDEAITDHLSRWFISRKRQKDYEQTIFEQGLKIKNMESAQDYIEKELKQIRTDYLGNIMS